MRNNFKILPIVTSLLTAWTTQAQEVAFSPDMIRSLVSEGQNIDLSFFEKGFSVPPGAYRLTVNVNGEFATIGMREVREYNGVLLPVFRAKDLHFFGLKEDIQAKFSGLSPEDELFPLSKYIDSAQSEFDAQTMTVNVSIPQLYVQSDDGWVDVVASDLWDYGEPGAVLNYNVSATRYDGRGDNYRSDNIYANVSGHINFGAWRLYSSGSTTYINSKSDNYQYREHTWERWNTYLERDVPTLQGTMQIGEIATSSEIFDSVPLRGIRLATNMQMLPRRDRSYTPIIEGVANSNAQIIIRQNSHIVYTANVAAGPFRLDNLPIVADFGDLEVLIKEADGTERVMLVPCSSVPNMLKQGQFRYDFSAGKYDFNGHSNSKNTGVLMGTVGYGFPHDITVYGGSTFANDYLAFALGTGMSLGSYGAVAADVIYSHHAEDKRRGLSEADGSAWRVRYEKTLSEFGTRVNVANYQYITSGYASLQDFVEYGSGNSSLWWSNGKMRNRWQAQISQSLGNFGSLHLGGDYATYHGNASDIKTFNIGYSTTLKNIGVNLNYSRSYEQIGRLNNKTWESSDTLMLTLNIPFDLFFRNSTSSFVTNTNVSYQGQMDRRISGEKVYSQSVVMSGNSENGRWGWTASQELGDHKDRASSISLSYGGDRFHANAGYTRSHYLQNYQLGLSGGLVVHKTGITPTAQAYDSVAIVEVPDTPDVRISNAFNASTDFFGHGVLSYMNNYMKNTVSIDPSSIKPGGLLLDSTDRVVVPTKGAIVRVSYPIRFGQHAVFTLKRHDGGLVPFGASVELLQENGERDPYVSGLVGEQGRVYLTALPKSGKLRVKIGGSYEYFRYELTQEAQPDDKFVPVETQTIFATNN